MKRAFVSFFNRFKSRRSSAASLPNINHLAFKYGKDRRRHPRVNFPKSFSFFDQPHFEWKNIRFDIVDLSKGGVCLLDVQDVFPATLGSELELTWVSAKLKQPLRLQLVGASYQKKHLEFKFVSQKLAHEIEEFLKAGVLGQKMRSSVLSSHSHMDTPIVELWVGVDGSHLTFHSDPHFTASLETTGLIVDFYKGSLPVYGKAHPRKGQVLSLEERVQLLFFISNFPVISTRVANLLEEWCDSEIGMEQAG